MNLFKKLTSLFAVSVMCATATFANAQSATDAANAGLNMFAGALAGTGMVPITPVCGTSSISPVFIYNNTSVAQTGSITIPSGLSYQVQIFNTYDDAQNSPFGQCDGRGEWISAPEFQSNFTVQPGQMLTYWLGMGGLDYNLLTSSNSFGVGGLPSNTKGQSWYDFQLSLNADESFVKLTLVYKGTGGTGTNSHQNGFNVMNMTTDPTTGQYVMTNTIISPYSSSTNSSIVYGNGEPIGFAWMP